MIDYGQLGTENDPILGMAISSGRLSQQAPCHALADNVAYETSQNIDH